MKFKLIILFFCLTGIEMQAHGGHLATFKYSIQAEEIILEFKIENEVLDHFKIEKDCPNFQTATAICLVNHIKENVSFEINNDSVSFELINSKKDKRFFFLVLKAKGDFSNCENIKINNQCFLKYDQRFENRIIIQKGEELKSYRMSKKHQEINIL